MNKDKAILAAIIAFYNAPYLCKECYEKRYGKNGFT